MAKNMAFNLSDLLWLRVPTELVMPCAMMPSGASEVSFDNQPSLS